MVIYCTTNLVNGKKYIGKDLHNNPNYLGSGVFFRQAVEKYGRKNFKKEILQDCIDREDLKESELYWIDYFNAHISPLFYNMAYGYGGGGLMSESGKEQIRLANKRRGMPKETLAKQLKTRRENGYTHHSEETKKKMSDAMYRRIENGYSQKGENNGNYGNKFSKETKEKIGKKSSEKFVKNKEKWEKIFDEKGATLYKFDINKNFLKEYPSITKAKKYGEASTAVEKVLNKNKTGFYSHSKDGFYWVRKKDYDKWN